MQTPLCDEYKRRELENPSNRFRHCSDGHKIPASRCKETDDRFCGGSDVLAGSDGILNHGSICPMLNANGAKEAISALKTNTAMIELQNESDIEARCCLEAHVDLGEFALLESSASLPFFSFIPPFL